MSSHVAGLLKTWANTRDPRVADEVEAADPKRWAKSFSTIARSKKAIALGRIARMPDDDPRVTTFLLACLQKARWPGPTAQPLWELVFAKLVSLEDVRAVPVLEAAADDLPAILGEPKAAWLRHTLTATARAIAQARPKLKTPSRASKPTPKQPARSVLEIVKPVFEAPSSREARLIVSDALLEQQNQWGELISVQLTQGPRAPAARALLTKRTVYADAAGPIAPLTSRNDRTFEGGFIATCHLNGRAARPQ